VPAQERDKPADLAALVRLGAGEVEWHADDDLADTFALDDAGDRGSDRCRVQGMDRLARVGEETELVAEGDTGPTQTRVKGEDSHVQ
jgi:hypothetical protein